MAYQRNGFTPVGIPDTRFVNQFDVSAGGVPVCKGDAVFRQGGKVTAIPTGQDPAKQGFGVVLAVYTTAGTPLTFSNTKFIASANIGRADVCWDVNQIYTVQCVASVGVGDYGKNVHIDASAANARTGLSGMSVTVPASASTNDPFKIIQISPFEELGSFTAGAGGNNGVTVAWNNHFLRTPTAGQ